MGVAAADPFVNVCLQAGGETHTSKLQGICELCIALLVYEHTVTLAYQLAMSVCDK